jgi:hypothetical protein
VTRLVGTSHLSYKSLKVLESVFSVIEVIFFLDYVVLKTEVERTWLIRIIQDMSEYR